MRRITPPLQGSSKVSGSFGRTRLHYALVFLAALAFVPAARTLLDVGRTNEYAGHSLFVPLFAAVVAWTDRDRLRAAAGPGDSRGACLIMIGLATLGIGYLDHSPFIQGLAVPFV